MNSAALHSEATCITHLYHALVYILHVAEIGGIGQLRVNQ
jgi:hypothetical protein